MDVRTLRNLTRVARTGSLSAASDEACLTVQALAAQLNKAEDQFGFRIFKRSNKGLHLTERGHALMPYIEKVVESARQLDSKAAELSQATPRLLRAALNSTLPADINQCIVKRMMQVFSDYHLEFSFAESIENLSKLRNDNIDLAVLIGPPQADLASLELADLHIDVVGAYHGADAEAYSDLSDKLLVRPTSDCPYSTSFERFLDSSQTVSQWGHRMIYSGSETLTVSLIKQLDGVGVVSRAAACKHGLSIVPGFEDSLPVRLVVNNVDLPIRALEQLTRPLQHSPQRNIRQQAYRHTEEQVLTEISA